MASTLNRGTKAAPRWFGQYKASDGKWKMKKAPVDELPLTGKYAADEKIVQKWIDQVQEDVKAGKPDPRKPQLAGPLMETWLLSLSNRAKYEDSSRVKKYIVPHFARVPIRAVTKAAIVLWLDELKRTTVTRRTRNGKTLDGVEVLSAGSRRNLFGLLSRFLSWCSARDHVDINVCRNVPKEERPKEGNKKRRVWLSDPEKVQAMCWALGPDFGLMFATARSGGLRPSEAAGLRVADTDALGEEGVLHVQHSYDLAMLKEDKGHGDERKDKWSPIRDATVAASLLALAARRRAAGAGEDERLFDFLPAKPSAIRAAWARRWRKAAAAVGGIDGLGWYESTRHSFASQALADGAKYEEVSRALGHANISTTAKFYDRHVERAFKSLPVSDIGAPLPDRKVLQFPAKKTA